MYSKRHSLSICIPTYNRLETLKSTLESVLALHNLEDFNYEIIISEDADNSVSRNYVSKLNNKRIKFVFNKKHGQFNNLNNLVSLAQSNWILFLHDDDMLHRDYLLETLKYMSQPHIDFVWTGREFIDGNDKHIQYFLASKKEEGAVVILENQQLERILASGGYEDLRTTVGMMVTGLLAKKELILKAECFNTKLSINADGLFINKLQFLAESAVYINRPLVSYRITDATERAKPSKSGIIYDEMKKILDLTLSFMKPRLDSTVFLQRKKKYWHNFYVNSVRINGSLLWIALRYENNYLRRLQKQFSILHDIYVHCPEIYFNPYTYFTITISFFPQSLLRIMYSVYLRYI